MARFLACGDSALTVELGQGISPEINARVTALVEKPQQPPTDIGIFALYLYKRETVPLIYQYLDEGNPPDAPGHFPEWLHKRREVGVYLFEGECVDIGTPQAYKEICERFAQK